MLTGPRNCLTDVPGIAAGNAEDRAARTGATVILPREAAIAACDVRGGGPGTRETDALALSGLVEKADAVVLSGGSVYGLAAADAVTALLGAEGRGFSLVEQEGVPPSPIVPAAILYDLSHEGDKDWGDTPPYARLGREALAAAREGGPLRLGSCGAGMGARAGRHESGLGAASLKLPSGATIGAAAAVNSFGSPYMPGTSCFWAAPFEIAGEFGGRGPGAKAQGFPADAKAGPSGRTNTTLVVVATDAALTKQQAQRVAVMAQDGLARAIRPAHGPTDGDVVFVLSTAKRPLADPAVLGVIEIGNAAADTVARAIARGVYAAEGKAD